MDIDAGQLDITTIALTRNASKHFQRFGVAPRNVVGAETLELRILGGLTSLHSAFEQLRVNGIATNGRLGIIYDTGIATGILPRRVVPLDQAIRLERTVTV